MPLCPAGKSIQPGLIAIQNILGAQADLPVVSEMMMIPIPTTYPPPFSLLQMAEYASIASGFVYPGINNAQKIINFLNLIDGFKNYSLL